VELVDSMTTTRVGAVTSQDPPAQRRHLRSTPGPGALRSAPAEPVRQIESGQAVWRVPCGDMIHRERCVTVSLNAGEVVVTGPPGETARLSAGQLGQLRAALTEAAKLAERQR
jgi:hypothetical protein